MARGVNKVILVGNIGSDPDMKYTQGGMAICTLSLATTSVRKDTEGNQQERTEWHRVKLFGKLGEIAGEYIKKGRQVYIEGEIRYGRLEVADGDHRHAVGSVEFLVEVAYALRGNGLEEFGKPDRQPVHVARLAEDRLHLRRLHP